MDKDAALAQLITKQLEESVGQKLALIDEMARKQAEVERRLGEIPGGWGDQIKALEEEVRNMQTRANRPGAPAGNDAEAKAFAAWLRRGDRAPETRDLSTDNESDGGFLVPSPIRQQILTALVEVSPIRANAAQLTISDGSSISIPVEEDGEYGAQWVGEREERGKTTTVKFGQKEIPLREIYAFPHVTQKMLDDAGINVEQFVSSRVGIALGQRENRSFLKGSGAKEPEGVLSNADTSAVETAASGALAADDVLDLIYEVPTQYAQGGGLYLHRKITLALRKLKDSQNQYLWQPALQAGQPATFAGVPLRETPDMDDAVTAGKTVMFFSNLRNSYQIVDKSTMSMLRDPYSNKPLVGFYTTARTGGAVTRPKAVSKLEVKA